MIEFILYVWLASGSRPRSLPEKIDSFDSHFACMVELAEWRKRGFGGACVEHDAR